MSDEKNWAEAKRQAASLTNVYKRLVDAGKVFDDVVKARGLVADLHKQEKALGKRIMDAAQRVESAEREAVEVEKATAAVKARCEREIAKAEENRHQKLAEFARTLKQREDEVRTETDALNNYLRKIEAEHANKRQALKDQIAHIQERLEEVERQRAEMIERMKDIGRSDRQRSLASD